MLKKLLPNEHVQTIHDIKPETLKERGIKGIITDLDNTLVPWDEANATPEVIEWFQLMEKHQISVMIISNNNLARVKLFSEPLETPYVFSARKPLRRSFKKAAIEMNLNKDEVVVVGDQLLTDVLGGNLAGFYTILVVPIVQSDATITKINRAIERRVMNYFRKKGWMTWEE